MPRSRTGSARAARSLVRRHRSHPTGHQPEGTGPFPAFGSSRPPGQPQRPAAAEGGRHPTGRRHGHDRLPETGRPVRPHQRRRGHGPCRQGCRRPLPPRRSLVDRSSRLRAECFPGTHRPRRPAPHIQRRRPERVHHATKSIVHQISRAATTTPTEPSTTEAGLTDGQEESGQDPHAPTTTDDAPETPAHEPATPAPVPPTPGAVTTSPRTPVPRPPSVRPPSPSWQAARPPTSAGTKDEIPSLWGTDQQAYFRPLDRDLPAGTNSFQRAGLSGSIYAQRWWSAATPAVRDQVAELRPARGEFARIPPEIDRDLLRFAEDQGLDTWTHHWVKEEIRTGWWDEISRLSDPAASGHP